MCELAILDPSEASLSELSEFAHTLYQQQGDSLGLVGVHDKGDRFGFSIRKSLEPSIEETEAFIEDIQARDDTARLIVHGRLATHGERDLNGAHPIEIDCPECDIDYVLHNGVVYNYRRLTNEYEKKGHEFATEVDSEAIAHAHGSVPSDFNESLTRVFAREPAFVLLSPERIYTYTAGSYLLDDNGYMTTGTRDLGPDPDTERYREVIYTPTGGS